jgi:hypothetical protein
MINHKTSVMVVTLLMFSFSTLLAQVERVLYQTFLLNDSTDNITFNMKDNYEVITWHHDKDVMIESTVEIKGGSMDLLKNFVNDGRYLVQPKLELPVTVFQLAFDKTKRETLKLNGRICDEIVYHRIYLPDDYVKISDNVYSRKTESILVTKDK